VRVLRFGRVLENMDYIINVLININNNGYIIIKTHVGGFSRAGCFVSLFSMSMPSFLSAV
jgi:hypothetical protein